MFKRNLNRYQIVSVKKAGISPEANFRDIHILFRVCKEDER